MSSSTRFTLGTSVALTIILAAGAAGAQVVRIVNYSDWDIEELYLSPAGARDWGPDQLGDDVLTAGDSYVDIPAYCGTYDLLLIDDERDECVVTDIYLCHEAIDITNDALDSCVGDTALYGSQHGGAVTCGIGFELVFVLPPLLWLRSARRSRRPVAAAL